MTITDQKGKFQPNSNGIIADKLLDPTPNDDDKDWYWTNSERPTSPDGVSESFEDNPRLLRNRFYSAPSSAIKIVTLTDAFSLELVEVTGLGQKDGGKSILTIDWGFKSSAAKQDKLIERTN